jgi:tetratricopeptide (TPR) repeat protein
MSYTRRLHAAPKGVGTGATVIEGSESILHYAVEGRLGAGGMGVVYRAVDTRLGRPVALKFLPDGVAVRPDAKQRLLLEARAAANLDHPNIGVIYGIEEVDERLFIAMALYEGATLEQRLAGGPLPAHEAADLVLQAARGLAKAHDQGIVHRDIKPANLFLTREGLLKILDFGLVKHDDANDGLTQPGTMVGTPEYMAPEQIRGQAADRRADLWALGVVLYELLTGVSPFRTEGGITATILRIVSAQPTPLTELDAGLPAAFQDVVDRALAKDPDERYASAREFAAELEAAAGARRDGGGGRAAAAPPGVAAGLASVASIPSTAAATSASASSIVDLTLGDVGAAQVSALLEPVPRSSRFVGRVEELGALRARLERDRIVAIRGMAGEGKSVVASRLVRDLYPDDRICWFTFDPIEKNTVDALFWSVAAFLARHGESLLWRYLQGEIEAHRPLDRTIRLNLFLSSLGDSDCAFCFDDVHLVAESAEVSELFKSIQRLMGNGASGGRAGFVIMGRELPRDLEHLAESLTGLAREEVAALVEAHGLALPEKLLDRLSERTHGNPTLLELAISALGRMGDDHAAMAAFIESMAGRSDIRDYVMNHIYAGLQPEEKAVVDALSIFPGAVEIAVAEETLAQGGLQGIVRCVDALIQKSVVHETGKGQIYCLDLVREFCYRTLDGRTKRALHAHAAAHFEAAKNPLRAAHHALEQGDAGRALALLTDNVKAIIDAGGAAALLEQLPRFADADLDDDERSRLTLTRGQALTIVGEYRRAMALYQDALDEVLDDEGRSELFCRLGSASNELGEFDAAVGFAREALESADIAGDDALAAHAQRVLGVALYRLNRLDEARSAFEAGLALVDAEADASLAAYLDQYLGIVDARQGRADVARARFEKSRKAFRGLRDRSGEAMATGNLAMAYGLLGQPDRELSLNQRVLEVLDAVGDVGNLLVLHNNLGDAHHRAGRFEEAISHYERLIGYAHRIEHRPWWGAGLVGLAENHLAMGRPDDALRHAEAARDLLEGVLNTGTDVAVELAMTCRVLGQVHLARGDPSGARAWFERSVPPFEAAHEAEELAKARSGLEAAIAASGPRP